MQRILAVAAFIQFFLCVLLAVAIPKATTISLGILVCGSFVLLLQQAAGTSLISNVSHPKWIASISLPLALAVSGFWTDQTSTETLQAAASLGFTLVACHIIAEATTRISPAIQRGCYLGFLVGFAVAASVAALDLSHSQVISRWVFTAWPTLPEALTQHIVFEGGQAVYVSEATTNRRAIVLTCLLPAYGLCSLKTRSSPAAQTVWLIGATAFSAHALITFSLTSQIASIAFAATFSVAWLLPRFTRAAMKVAWLSTWALALPIAFGLANIGIHDAKWLPSSATERVSIWSGVAEDIWERPILGHGIGSKSKYSSGPESATRHADERQSTLAYHPHNGYLQIWFELGFVGVVLFAGLGLWVLREIDVSADNLQPFLFGLFSVIAVINLTGFGVWQHWLLSAFGMGAALVCVMSHREVIYTRGNSQ